MVAARLSTWSVGVLGTGLALTASQVGAATVVDPISAVDTSHFGSNTASLTIDGSGFTATGQAAIATGATAPTVWPASAGAFGDNYVSASQGGANTSVNTPAVTITYQLSATPVDIASLHYWQYDGDSVGRDLKSFDISFSTDGVTFSTPQHFTGLPQQSGDNVGTAGEDLALTAPATGVEFAQINNMTNYGSPDSFGSFYGIEEVRFVTTPEPACAGLIALASFGLLSRRRRERR